MSDAKFHIGDLLSVSTGCLLSPRKMESIYAILNHLTGDNLMTHQLPAANRIAEPYLLDQYPWLAKIEPPTHIQSIDDLHAWLAPLIAEYGEMHAVAPMPEMAWGVHDPIADLQAMTDKPIVVVAAGDSE